MKGIAEKTLRYIMFAGLLLAGLTIIIMTPWSSRMGATGSPQRMLLLWVFSVLGALPFAIYFLYKFAQQPEWNAASGKTVEATKARPFSRYTYVAIGVVGVALALAWTVKGIPLDFLVMVMTASASLFGGIISFFGLLVGQVFAGLLGLINPLWVSWCPGYFLTSLPVFIYDAAIYAFAGYSYFKYVHNRGIRAFLPAFLTAWILSVLVVQIGWLMGHYIINVPWPQARTYMLQDWFTFQSTFPYLPYWLLHAVAYVPISFLLGHVVRRGWRGRR